MPNKHINSPAIKKEGNENKGSSGNRRWNRNKNRNYTSRDKNSGTSQTYRSSNFEGKTPELKGYYFDAMTISHAEGFNRTKRELLEYIARHEKLGPLIATSLESGAPNFGLMPVKPDLSDPDIDFLKDIYNEEIKLYSRTKKSQTWLCKNNNPRS